MAQFLPATAPAAELSPTAEQALRLTPIQANIQYDRPSAADTAKCTIKAEKLAKATSWVVSDEQGLVLRRFTDTNADNVVDQWSYFKDGLEVYRDIDANYNGKADQYRWFHTAGTRWGLDRNEDGQIDTWKQISAEEVGAEAVEAIKQADVASFARLLLTADELNTLGLGGDKLADLKKQIAAVPNRFKTLVPRQIKLSPQTAFIDFGAAQPGLVPAGTDGSTQDLVVYENVLALVETKGNHQQIQLGTIVRVGDVWRLIDVPAIESGHQSIAQGSFFQTALANRAGQQDVPTGGPSEKVQAMMAELEKLDREANTATPQKQAKLNTRRTELLEGLAGASTDPEQREQWVRQMADTVSVAVQTGTYDDGIERLISLEKKLKADKMDAELLAYVTFRRMSAWYAKSLQDSDGDLADIQEKWLSELAAFVKDYPKSSDAPEALLQLAIAEEFSGQIDKAKGWYRQIVTQFASSLPAKKAAGAIRRLDSVGNPVRLRGKNLQGRLVDLSQYRGKTVLVQYWATWCEPCMADMARLKELHAKYGKQGFTVVGISLDNDRQDVVDFLSRNRLPWQQIYETGGLESRLANEMGILTLPTMMLIDSKGNVVNRSIHVTELDTELKKILR